MGGLEGEAGGAAAGGELEVEERQERQALEEGLEVGTFPAVRVEQVKTQGT